MHSSTHIKWKCPISDWVKYALKARVILLVRALSSAPGFCFVLFLLGRSGQMCDYILIHRLWPVVWLGGQKLGRNMIRKFMQRKSEKEVQTSLNG